MVRKNTRQQTGRILLALASAYFIGQACGAPPPNQPVIQSPSWITQSIPTETVYIAFTLMDNGDPFTVTLAYEDDPPQNITAAFTDGGNSTETRTHHHARVALPQVGSYLLTVNQNGAEGDWSATRDVVRVLGPTVELGPLEDQLGTVLQQTAMGVLDDPSGATRLLFADTFTASGARAATHASSTDSDASDGIDLDYQGGAVVQDVLPLQSGEEEVWLTAPFLRGGDLYAYYMRIDHDATPQLQGVGLARAPGGTPPFTRLTFPAAQPPGGGHFADDYSMFHAGELPRIRGVVPQGSDLWLYGADGDPSVGWAGVNGMALVRVPLASAEDPSAFEFYVQDPSTGKRSWSSTGGTWAHLTTNVGAGPSVHWNDHLQRWIAVYTSINDLIDPYWLWHQDSKIAISVADSLTGPWSTLVQAWGMPPTRLGAQGSARDAMHLADFDNGSRIYLVATDTAWQGVPRNAFLYEVDLDALNLPSGPITPVLDDLPTPTNDNPYTVSGYATPGDTVTITIASNPVASAVADADDGRFRIPVVLADGRNDIRAYSTDGNGVRSGNSWLRRISYANNVDRDQTNTTISEDTVWTEGDGSPYKVTGTFTVASGATLTLGAGVTVEFQTDDSFVVNGTLDVQGTSGKRVVFTSASKVRGAWKGIDVNGFGVIDYAKIEYAERGVEVAVAPATLTVSNSWIHEFSNAGIHFDNGSIDATIVGNEIINSTATLARQGNGIYSFKNGSTITIDGNVIKGATKGLNIDRSSPLVDGNWFEDNSDGIYLEQLNASPTITNNEVTANGRGIVLRHFFGGPKPTINDNRIHANDGSELVVPSYGNTHPRIDAENNYWGTTDPNQIEIEVVHRNDEDRAPVADYLPFRDEFGDVVPVGNRIGGLIDQDTTLAQNSDHEVVGGLFVAPGVTLTVEPGVTLDFNGNLRLWVDGSLVVNGVDGNLATFTRTSDPTRGSWRGIDVSGSGSVAIDRAEIRYANRGVEFWGGSSGSVSESLIHDFADTGVYFDDGSITATVLGNTIANSTLSSSRQGYGVYTLLNGTGITVESNVIKGTTRGLYIFKSSPNVVGNRIEDNSDGIYVKWYPSQPTITDNDITGNGRGIFLVHNASHPQPVITGNRIHDNDGYELQIPTYGSPVVIDATYNYWGTIDPNEIEIEIYHANDNSGSPVAQYHPFVDEFGDEVFQDARIGGAIQEDTTLDEHPQYEVVGGLYVAAGATLTIPAGTTLAFNGFLRLDVDGALVVQGTEADPVVFTPHLDAGEVASRGAWRGIDLRGSGSVIDGAVIEYAERGVEIFAPATATVQNSQILEFSDYGLYIDNGSGDATISGNDIVNLTAAPLARQGEGIYARLITGSTLIENNVVMGGSKGISIFRASPQVIGNWIEDNSQGIYVKWYPSQPTVTDNDITNNGAGIVLVEENGHPLITANGNRIHANAGLEFDTNTGWANAGSIVLDAENNYWGTTDPFEIEQEIYHHNDSTSSAPTVDFHPYLDEDGVPFDGGGDYLSGPVDDGNTTLDPGTVYTVVGVLSVGTGKTLTVPAGVRIEFLPGTSMVVSGTVSVEGAAGNLVTFTGSTANRGSWKGIEIQAAGSVFDGARVEYAQRAIEVVGPHSITVSNSEIVEFSDVGIYLDSGAGNATIAGNQIVNSTTSPAVRQGEGIYVRLSSGTVTIQGNEIRGAIKGINIFKSSPTVDGNQIEDNADGIYIKWAPSLPAITDNDITGNGQGIVLDENAGHPRPTINGNRIHANDAENLHADRFWPTPRSLVIDAENNYWGSTDPVAVEASIFHANDDLTSQIVDFVPFTELDGTIASSPDMLSGTLDSTTPALVAGASYDVLGWLEVPAGESFTIPEGVTLGMRAGAGIQVWGSLTVAGTSVDPVLVTSGVVPKGRGDWDGIRIAASGAGSSISYATLEYATTAVRVTSAAVPIQNATIREFSATGIALYQSAPGPIADNTIDNGNGAGTGLYVHASSPSITGNTIERTANGIHVLQGANPVINGNNVVANNAVGIRLTGQSGGGVDPAPVINENQLLQTNTVTLHTENFVVGTGSAVDARENWWGTTDATQIRSQITADPPDSGVVDFSDYLDAPGGSPAPGSGSKFSALISSISATPKVIAPTFSETMTVSFELHEDATVSMLIYGEEDDARTTLLHSQSQAMTAGSRSFVWNGTQTDGSVLPDEAYVYRLEADNGSEVFVYDPARENALFPQVVVPLPNRFDNLRNDYWKFTYTVDIAPGRVHFRATPNGGSTFRFIDDEPFPVGPNPIIFDGRKLDGSLLQVPTTFYVGTPIRLKPNSVILQRTSPAVTGTGTAPNVEVKSNPYLVYHSYEQFSRMVFRVDQDAVVTVKILKPGFGDPGDPNGVVATLLDAQPLAAVDGGGDPIDHVFEWRGYDPDDTNEILTSEEGPFTFSIEAANPAQANLKTLYRGVLSLRK